MHRPIPRAAVLGAAALALASTLTAQQPAQTPQQPIFRSGVELVQVDVVVVDKDGRHVRGLKAADFAVLDRDKPQTIATFEEVSHERPAEAAPAPMLTRPARLDVGNNQTARSDRLVVMVIDDLHIYKGRTERAQDVARKIVTQLGPQASMAVLYTSANRNTQVTEDRAELLAAIDTLRGRQSVRRPNQARDDQSLSGSGENSIDPDWTVRFRKGYRPGGPPAPPANKDPLVALAAGVLPKPDLPMRLYASVFPGERKLATVAAAIEITAPTKVLLGPDGRLHDQVSYGVLVVDEKKTKVTSRTHVAARIALKPRAAVRSPEDDPNMPGLVAYQIPLSLELAPGKYQLRASATSTRLGKGGSVYLTIEVPDFAKEEIAVAGMTLGYGDGEHVPVADLPKQAPRRAARAPFPPSLDRTFTPADTLRLYFEVARRTPAGLVRTKVEILDGSDDVRAWVEREVPANDRGHVDVRLPLATLAPGAYRLRVTAGDGTSAAAREVAIVIQ